MRKSAVWLALSVSLLLADIGQALALEVGAARVRSFIDEPLVATIPVQVDNIQQRDSLSATLAPESEYVARGLPPLADADDLVVQVVEGGNLEEMLIEIRSLSEVSEPYMGLVLQLTWDGGNQVQEFTLLLDPQPVMAEEPDSNEPMPAPLAPPEPAQTAEPESVETVESEDEAELRQLAEEMGNTPGITISRDEKADVVIRKVRPDDYLAGNRGGGETVIVRSKSPGAAMATEQPSYTGDSYGPVAAGETLWRIATKLRPGNDVSMQQVMAAIYAANPQAFEGSYETLKKGAMLSVPSAQTMRATEAEAPVAATRSQPSASSSAEPAAFAEEAAPDKEPVEDVASEDLSEETRPGIWNTPEPEVDEAELDKKGGLITRQGQAPVAEADSEDDAASEETAMADSTDTATSDEQSSMQTGDAKAVAGGGEPVAGAVDYSALEDSELESPELDAAEVTESEAEDGLAPESLEAETETALSGEAAGDSTQPPAEEPASQDDGATAAGNENTLKLGAAIILVLLLTYWWYRRRRASEEAEAPAAYAMPLTDEDQAQEEDSLPKPPTFQAEDEVTETGVIGAASIDEDARQEATPGDPTLEQADTYLSYGLYESAADTLHKGIQAEPDRADLRMKLLETHEAAGNQDEFVAAVQDWENSGNPPDEAQRSNIEAMGRNAAPGVGLFAAGGVAAAAFSSNDDNRESSESPQTEEKPAEELPEADFDLDSGSEDFGVSSDFGRDSTEPSGSAAESVSLDLDLDEDSSTKAGEASAAESTDDLELPSLDLDLDESADVASPEGEEQQAASAEDSSLNFNLDELDFDESPAETPTSPEVSETAEPQESADLSLDDDDLNLSLDESPTDSDEPAATDAGDSAQGEESEFDVKLDLAQAYLDMGEPDLAKGLLDEVVEGGNDTQRANAEKLLQDVDQA